MTWKKLTDRIELIRAHHESGIRQALVDWSAETPPGSRGNQILTRKQQSDLQELVVAMFVKLGEAQCCDLLPKSTLPQQFELDCDDLIKSVADEAQARWNTLVGRYHIETESSCTPLDADSEVRERVRGQLTTAADRLILEAWSSQEARLEAEGSRAAHVSRLARDFPDESVQLVSILPEPAVEESNALFSRPRSLLGHNIERLRSDKGWSMDELSKNSTVHKKTLIRINKGHGANPDTLKRIADALGVTVSMLKS